MTNDGDQPNSKGHDRYLDADVYFRLPGQPSSGTCFAGGGYRWNRLSTTNYIKIGSRPQFDGAHDFMPLMFGVLA